jgi:hypothetical protein
VETEDWEVVDTIELPIPDTELHCNRWGYAFDTERNILFLTVRASLIAVDLNTKNSTVLDTGVVQPVFFEPTSKLLYYGGAMALVVANVVPDSTNLYRLDHRSSILSFSSANWISYMTIIPCNAGS